MTIDSQIEKRIANLARLKINPEEEKVILESVNQILSWIEQLKEVETEHIDYLLSHHQSLRQRPDEINDGDISEIIVKNAPNTEFNMFVVPKVVE